MALYAVDESTRYPASLIRVDTDDPIGARVGYQGACFDIIDKEIVGIVFPPLDRDILRVVVTRKDYLQPIIRKETALDIGV